jgi:hypothetical protein
MSRIKFWPHATVIILLCAVAAGAGVFLWKKYERTASAKEMPSAARIEKIDGQVGLNRSLDANATNKDWIEATPNTPISVGDRILTRDNSRTQIAFTGRNFATIDANTSLDVLQLSREQTQVALRNGSGLFDIGALPSGQAFEVATPCGALDPQQPGVYQIAIDNNGNAVATAYSGRAQIIGAGGNGVIEKGETLTLACQGDNKGVISRVDAGQAGSVLDSYYHYRYPRTYDGRYRDYNAYLEDPYYYDPYRRDVSYQYVDEYVPGVEDLDDYGNWQYISDYGYCWHPYADTAWAPYQSGYWQTDYPFGLTWISNEPWGYAPYHYGRWTYYSNQWFWVPAAVNTYPVYSPELVAFIPFGNSSVAWVALGPGDPWSPLYYDQYWQPAYSAQPVYIDQRIVNLSVPGAVSVVPVQSFSQVIDPRIITRADPQTLANVRLVQDPLAVDSLRRVAFQTRDAQRKINLPASLAQRIENTPVVTTTVPSAPFKKDLAQAMRIQSLPAQAQNKKLQLEDHRSAMANQQPGRPAVPGQAPNLPSELARERQMAEFAKEAARGNPIAKQQMQQLRRQQLEEQKASRAPRSLGPPVSGGAQGEKAGNPVRPAAPRMNPRAQPEMRPMPQPRAMPQPQPRVTRPPVTYQQPRAQPQVNIRPQTPVQAQPQPRAMPRIEARPQPRVQAPVVRPQAQPQPRPQPQPRAQPQPQPKAQPQPAQNAQPQPAQKAQPQPAQKAQPPGQKKKPPER